MTAGTRPAVGRSTHPLIVAGRTAIRGYGEITSRWRPDPEFLVIGAKRGGSTSFYYDLLRHPAVCPLFPRPDRLPKATTTKGVHYFDQHYHRGERWYRSHLPSTAVRRRLERKTGLPAITGEASPYYLFHPYAAQRAAGLLPSARIIAVLRDPVERTYSHWKERRRADAEPLDFPAALAAEAHRLGGFDESGLAAPDAYSYAHEQQSYVRQSEYDTAMARWLDCYPRDQVLVIASEDYYREPQRALDSAAAFLGLPDAPRASGVVHNSAAGAALPPALRAELAAHFAPHNRNLEDLLGRRMGWV